MQDQAELKLAEGEVVAPGPLVQAANLRRLPGALSERYIASRDEYEQQFRQLIEDGIQSGEFAATDVALACHINPDPDALGSMLGLAEFLKTRGTKVECSYGNVPFEHARWVDALPGGRAYHPLWAPYRVGFLAIDSLLFLWAMILIALFWRRNRWFPTATSLFLLADWVSEVLSLLVLWQIPSYAAVMSAYTLRDFFLLGILALVGTLYLRDSARVRATFTE